MRFIMFQNSSLFNEHLVWLSWTNGYYHVPWCDSTKCMTGLNELKECLFPCFAIWVRKMNVLYDLVELKGFLSRFTILVWKMNIWFDLVELMVITMFPDVSQ